MDTRPAWRRAWEWASEWRGSTSFWLVGAAAAGSATVAGYLVTGDWGGTAVWAAGGTVLVFVLVFLCRWVATPWLDLKELRRASSEDSARGEAADTQRRQAALEAKYRTYVDQQLERLRVTPDLILGSDTDWAKGEWGEFINLAWRTVTGIRHFDDSLADYVTATIAEAEDELGKDPFADTSDMLRLAARIIDTVQDTKTLY